MSPAAAVSIHRAHCFPSELLPAPPRSGVDSSWGGNFQGKGTVQSFVVPPAPAPCPRLYLSYLQGAGRGVKDYFLGEPSSGRRAKSSSTVLMLQVHASPSNLININLLSFSVGTVRLCLREGLNEQVFIHKHFTSRCIINWIVDQMAPQWLLYLSVCHKLHFFFPAPLYFLHLCANSCLMSLMRSSGALRVSANGLKSSMFH